MALVPESSTAFLQTCVKWQHSTCNVSIGDIVIIMEEGIIPTQWPLARVTKTHPGKDNIVRVADVRTIKGSYRRPVHKLAVLLPHNQDTEL